MKKFLMLLCAVTLILAMVGTASALSFSRTYHKNMWFNSSNDYKRWTFDLDKLRRIDPEDTIKNAQVSIKFKNRNPGEAERKIDLTALVADHKIYVTIKRLKGSFGVKWIKLKGNFWNNPSQGAPVPEPATILLMGVGLLGLVGYSRKRLKKAKQA